MRSSIIAAWIAPALFLAGCSAATGAAPETPASPNAPPAASEPWDGQAPRIDEQGAITVEVTPINLDNPGDTLEFQISLDTHSVDLSMDLAALATLTTDAGTTASALTWDAPLGGHHVSGTLAFPAEVLDGAAVVTLRLVDVDAPERIFTWER